MRKISLFILLAFLGLSFNLKAQSDSITIVSKKIKNKEVRYPVFSGINDLQVLNKIKQICEINKILSRIDITTLKDPTIDFSYTVNYNRNFILCISFFCCSNQGAHPFCGSADVVIDLKTGAEIGFADLFKQENINDILQLADKQLKKDIKEALEYAKNNQENGGCNIETVTGITETANLTVENLKQFRITEKGIEFLNPMSAFTAEQACIPNFGPISFAELKPFMKIILQ